MNSEDKHLVRAMVRRLVEARQSLKWKFDEDLVQAGQYQNCWTGVEMIDGVPLRIDTSKSYVLRDTFFIDFYVFYEDVEVIHKLVTYEPEVDGDIYDVDIVGVLKNAVEELRQEIVQQLNDPDSVLIKAIKRHDLLKMLPPWRRGRWSLPAGTFKEQPLPEKLSGSMLDVGPFQLIVPQQPIGTSFPVIFRGREGLDPKGQMGSWAFLARSSRRGSRKAAEKWLMSFSREDAEIFERDLDDPNFLRHLFRQVLTRAL